MPVTSPAAYISGLLVSPFSLILIPFSVSIPDPSTSPILDLTPVETTNKSQSIISSFPKLMPFTFPSSSINTSDAIRFL